MTEANILQQGPLYTNVMFIAFAQTKTSENVQHFTAQREVKVIPNVQMSQYSHETTPDEGTKTFASTPATSLMLRLNCAAGVNVTGLGKTVLFLTEAAHDLRKYLNYNTKCTKTKLLTRRYMPLRC